MTWGWLVGGGGGFLSGSRLGSSVGSPGGSRPGSSGSLSRVAVIAVVVGDFAGFSRGEIYRSIGALL
jgi:hypothetical protein